MDGAVDRELVSRARYRWFDSRPRRRHVIVFGKLLHSTLPGAFVAAMIAIAVVDCLRVGEKTAQKIKNYKSILHLVKKRNLFIYFTDLKNL